MEKAYLHINDPDGARRHRRKIHRQSGERAEEGNSAIEMANFYRYDGHVKL